jgi:hypothetical protein
MKGLLTNCLILKSRILFSSGIVATIYHSTQCTLKSTIKYERMKSTHINNSRSGVSEREPKMSVAFCGILHTECFLTFSDVSFYG